MAYQLKVEYYIGSMMNRLDSLSVIEHHVGSSSALSVVVDCTGSKMSVEPFRFDSVG